MPLETKKLSQYNDLLAENIDETTKLVSISGITALNKNIPVEEFVENSLTSEDTLRPLSALQGKTLSEAISLKASTEDLEDYAPINSPTFTGTVTIPSGADINGYAPLESPTLTGTVIIPLPPYGITTDIAIPASWINRGNNFVLGSQHTAKELDPDVAFGNVILGTNVVRDDDSNPFTGAANVVIGNDSATAGGSLIKSFLGNNGWNVIIGNNAAKEIGRNQHWDGITDTTDGNDSNVVIGDRAFRYAWSAKDSIAIGRLAGGAAGIEVKDSIYIGRQALPLNNSDGAHIDNEIVIGNTTGHGDDTATIAGDFLYVGNRLYVGEENFVGEINVDKIRARTTFTTYIIGGEFESIAIGAQSEGRQDLTFQTANLEIISNLQNIGPEDNIGLENDGASLSGIYEVFDISIAEIPGPDPEFDPPSGYNVTITLITSDNPITPNSGDLYNGTALNIWVGNLEVKVDSNLLPGTDKKYSLGAANFKWSEIFAETDIINTSDARLKTEISGFTVDELNAAKELSKRIGTYKFLSAIASKGDAARLHIGLTVQEAISIMEDNNLDPFKYGFICYDEWNAKYKTVIDVKGKPKVEAWEETYGDRVVYHPEIPAVEEVSHQELVSEAGNSYGFRYTELLAFICRGFEERLSALENA
jgi:hypothetical protein